MMLVYASATAAAAMTSAAPSPAVPLSPLGFVISMRRAGVDTPPEQAAPVVPQLPRNIDLRDVAIDMPELVVPLVERGPNLLIGAFGGRGKGMPKLVHIGLGWKF